MLPLLKLAGDGNDHTRKEAEGMLAQHFRLTEEERQQRSGKIGKFYRHIGSALEQMREAGLLEPPQGGFFRITELGRQVLAEKPSAINNKFLKQLAQPDTNHACPRTEEGTPAKTFQEAYGTLRRILAGDMLDAVKNASPEFFERLVVELLVQMGYGGSQEDAQRAIGRSGDEGIDGIIKEDPLGLDAIYLQAKRWENAVGRPEVQKFAGALQGQKARKGVLITTSAFTREATEYAAGIETKVILIDGAQLVELMIDYGVGVTTYDTYELKRINAGYFTDD